MFQLYISAATDLESERDLLGRAVAEIPTELGWRISQSPRRNEPADLDAVSTADVHLLLMGGDIRAPVGQEWLSARRAGRRPVPFLKQDVPRTSAARDFIRFVGEKASWRAFRDGAELRQMVLVLLANHILDRAPAFALSSMEIERLQIFRTELATSPSEVDVDEGMRGGAGDSSLIISTERYVPSEGILLRSEDKPDQGKEGSY